MLRDGPLDYYITFTAPILVVLGLYRKGEAFRFVHFHSSLLVDTVELLRCYS
jgi:hypothetical protein